MITTLCVVFPRRGLGGSGKAVLPPEVYILGMNIVLTADSPLGRSPQGMSLLYEQISWNHFVPLKSNQRSRVRCEVVQFGAEAVGFQLDCA